MRCPTCKNKILQKSGTQTRLRTQGQVVFDGEACKAQCFWCKAEVTLPIKLAEHATVEPEPRFVLRKPTR